MSVSPAPIQAQSCLLGQFSNVLVRAHTDLTTQKGAEEIERLAKRADVIILDEAHNFRNHGAKKTEDNPWGSRWWRMHEICRGKTVFLLTATLINNSFFDLVHQAELFTGVDADDHFASIGVQPRRARLLLQVRPPIHAVLNEAMGWTDSHLHRFRTGNGPYSPYFTTEFDLHEGDEGILEGDVRLDQVVAEKGDALWYDYDFGTAGSTS